MMNESVCTVENICNSTHKITKVNVQVGDNFSPTCDFLSPSLSLSPPPKALRSEHACLPPSDQSNQSTGTPSLCLFDSGSSRRASVRIYFQASCCDCGLRTLRSPLQVAAQSCRSAAPGCGPCGRSRLFLLAVSCCSVKGR